MCQNECLVYSYLNSTRNSSIETEYSGFSSGCTQYYSAHIRVLHCFHVYTLHLLCSLLKSSMLSVRPPIVQTAGWCRTPVRPRCLFRMFTKFKQMSNIFSSEDVIIKAMPPLRNG